MRSENICTLKIQLYVRRFVRSIQLYWLYKKAKMYKKLAKDTKGQHDKASYGYKIYIKMRPIFLTYGLIFHYLFIYY